MLLVDLLFSIAQLLILRGIFVYQSSFLQHLEELGLSSIDQMAELFHSYHTGWLFPAVEGGCEEWCLVLVLLVEGIRPLALLLARNQQVCLARLPFLHRVLVWLLRGFLWILGSE